MFNIFPTIQTDRLTLVEIGQEHLGDIFKLFSDTRVTQFYNVVTLTKESEAQKIIDWFQNRYIENAGIRWGISLKGHDNIIGTIGFNNFTRRHRANIGFDLQPDFWNNGYLSEALKAVIKFGFRNLDLNRIEAEVMQGNIASEKVLAKMGFKNEGVLRQWMYWNNKHYDMTMFSLLASDIRVTNNNGS
jgi:ribosomal-protein-alanine N-acetyltransferase